jgi:hypothetical protein
MVYGEFCEFTSAPEVEFSSKPDTVPAIPL